MRNLTLKAATMMLPLLSAPILNNAQNNDVQSKNGITVSASDNVYEFPDAALKLKSPAPNSVTDTGNVQFSFDVSGYQLGNQTPDANDKICANSAKGQHIHLILNNKPYEAFYTSDFTSHLTAGHYVCLAFLSRSYHESIKDKKAFVLTQFDAGTVTGKKENLDGPTLFYSRPKGKYAGKETKKLLLDFYLINTSLSADGNKVKATINGTEFILNKWVPYFIEGLPIGKNTIRLQLIDKTGKLIPGSFNDSGERTFELLPEEGGSK